MMKEGYKQTEVGVIPEDWEVKNILKSSTLKARIGWQGLTTAEYLKTGEYLLVTGTDFANGKINWESCNYVDRKRFVQDKNIQIRSSDILITKDGTIGKIAFINNLPLPGTLNSGVFVIRPINKSYLPVYCFYIFCSYYFEDFLRQLVAGSTINHLYQKDFITFNFPLPPTITEQTAIATALSDADALINSLEKLIAKKRNMKQGAMQKLLQPKEGWEMKKLGEIAEIFSGGTPSTSVQSYYNGNIPWITSSDLNKAQINSVEGSITQLGLNNSSSKMIKKGTLLVALYGATSGVTAISHINAAINQAVLAIIPKRNNTQFLYYVISNLKTWIIKTFIQGGQGNLSGNIFKELELEFPSLAEQTRIATILSDMDAEITALENKLEKYRNIKLGMMQNLLTGKIRLINK